MSDFNVFYSWQSDLPGNTTRFFIRECIDAAITFAEKTEAFEAQRDEATANTTGSPDIVTTLFSKIDNCALFIADISLCYTEEKNGNKRSPNPNVMLELGYAVSVLSWDRIICICNIDYGDCYPFDIAHNRITRYSLSEGNKAKEKNRISKIIFDNIIQLKNQQLRVKAGFAAHILGAYDCETKSVKGHLNAIQIGASKEYRKHNNELLEEAKRYYLELLELSEKIQSQKTENEQIEDTVDLEQFSNMSKGNVKESSEVFNGIKSFNIFQVTDTSIVWENLESDKSLIQRWLEIEVPDEFFDLYNLKKRASMIDWRGPSIIGLPEEKEKYEKLKAFMGILCELDVRTNYLQTFEGMLFIPLAIQNISVVKDSGIRVVLEVENAEIIEPNENLIWNEYDGLQGLLCRDDDDDDLGVIAELFALPEDGVIHVEEHFRVSRFSPSVLAPDGLSFIKPEKTKQNYEEELQEFIASTGGKKYYEFEINSLRPSECKWLDQGILIKPIGHEVKVRYRIHSEKTTGELEGELKL